MGRPLEYKSRVRLPAELPLPEPTVRRPPDVRVWGALVWIGTTALAWSISTHSFRVPGWLHGAAGGADVAQPPDDATPRGDAPARDGDSAPARHAFALASPDDSAPAKRNDSAPAKRDDSAPLQTTPPRSNRGATPAADDRLAIDPAALAPAGPAAAVTEVPAFAPPPAPTAEHAGGFTSGMSCEAAQSVYHQQVQIGGASGPADLTRDQFAGVLENGAWFSWCHVPSSFSMDVCVAVKGGRAVGVTVRTTPRSYNTEACVAKQAWRLRFPSSPRLDVTRTLFDAE